jgi:hypothetical protein
MAQLKSPRVIVLTEKQRGELIHWTRSPSAPAGKVRRAQMVLLAADGVAVREIQRRTGAQRKIVRRWLDRFRDRGIAGLEDLPRPGRPKVFSPLGRDGTRALGLHDAGRPWPLLEPVALRRTGS